MAKTVRLKSTKEVIRVSDEEAQKLVKTGKARYASKNEWRRWQDRPQSSRA